MGDIYKLRVFLKVAETGSVSRAASLMRVAQPALSRQIKVLEQEVGASLFKREAGGMTLTPAGQTLMRSVSSALNEIDKAFAGLRADPSTPRGIVRVGITSTAVPIFAGRILGRAVMDLPEVSISLTEGLSAELVELLRGAELDLAIASRAAAAGRTKAQPLFSDELVLVGRDSMGMPSGRPAKVKELDGVPLALPSKPSTLRSALENAAAGAGMKLNVVLEADTFNMRIQLAEAGVALTVVSSTLFQHLRRTSRTPLFHRPLSGPGLTRQIVLLRGANIKSPTAAEALQKIILEEVALAEKAGLHPL